MSEVREYINYEYFYKKLVNLPVGETWRLECEDGSSSEDDSCIYTLAFAKHKYEAEDGLMYDFIVYSYPKTLDAGLIQEDSEAGWAFSTCRVWCDITKTCNLKPFIRRPYHY